MNKSQSFIKDKIQALENASEYLYRRLEKCDLCPRNCRINRLKGKTGYCAIAKDVLVYSAFSHTGEEPSISGTHGSGTIFFSGCSLKCVYCQNYKFSQSLEGRIFTEEELADLICNLKDKGCHNINLVTPTHILPQLTKSLLLAFKKGLDIPLVYNTSGYEKEEIINCLAEIADIYLTDMKYITAKTAKKYSHAANYPVFNKESVTAMYRQKKETIFNGELLERGLIIRHLVLPGHTAETKAIIHWIKKNVPGALTSLMFQYRPYHQAGLYPEINRTIQAHEYQDIKEFAEMMALDGWIQDWPCKEELAGIYFEPFRG